METYAADEEEVVARLGLRLGTIYLGDGDCPWMLQDAVKFDVLNFVLRLQRGDTTFSFLRLKQMETPMAVEALRCVHAAAARGIKTLWVCEELPEAALRVLAAWPVATVQDLVVEGDLGAATVNALRRLAPNLVRLTIINSNYNMALLSAVDPAKLERLAIRIQNGPCAELHVAQGLELALRCPRLVVLDFRGSAASPWGGVALHLLAALCRAGTNDLQLGVRQARRLLGEPDFAAALAAGPGVAYVWNRNRAHLARPVQSLRGALGVRGLAERPLRAFEQQPGEMVPLSPAARRAAKESERWPDLLGLCALFGSQADIALRDGDHALAVRTGRWLIPPGWEFFVQRPASRPPT
jgi:hypothetical protein